MFFPRRRAITTFEGERGPRLTGGGGGRGGRLGIAGCGGGGGRAWEDLLDDEPIIGFVCVGSVEEVSMKRCDLMYAVWVCLPEDIPLQE